MEFNWGLMFSSYAAVFTPSILLMICVGTTAGIIMGALPGLTATMGVALLVPLTFGRPPLESLSMLIGIYCGAMYGGAISAILIRTPGTPAPTPDGSPGGATTGSPCGRAPRCGCRTPP